MMIMSFELDNKMTSGIRLSASSFTLDSPLYPIIPSTIQKDSSSKVLCYDVVLFSCLWVIPKKVAFIFLFPSLLNDGLVKMLLFNSSFNYRHILHFLGPLSFFWFPQPKPKFAVFLRFGTAREASKSCGFFTNLLSLPLSPLQNSILYSCSIPTKKAFFHKIWMCAQMEILFFPFIKLKVQ